MKRNFQPKNMLVTGGAGFIGANFIRYILNNESSIFIVNLDKLTYAGSLDNLHCLPNASQHLFVQGDVCDAHLLQTIFSEHAIDTVVHFAAESHVDRSIASPQIFIETNVMGTFTLLETALHNWRDKDFAECLFHHISTDEVYGSLSAKQTAFTEKTAYSPRSPYSASKASADHLVSAYYHTFGLPVTISNCSNNFGPYQHEEKFIPTIIRACLKQQPIPVYGNGKNIRDWLYVEDHCAAILKIIQHGTLGEKYNIGGNNEWENLKLAKTICEQMDLLFPQPFPYASLLKFVTDRPGHDFRYSINSAKIGQDIGWKPETPFLKGLQNTIKFFSFFAQG